MLGALARGAKDSVIAMSLKALVNDKFGQYGDITDCSIDTKTNKVVVQALLKGERERVTINLDKYEIEREGEVSYIVLKRFSASREWVALLLNRFLMDKRYKLPQAVSKLL
ncbi:MAG: hypothetical protein V4650_07840 [Pseudomonadota bacterium]